MTIGDTVDLVETRYPEAGAIPGRRVTVVAVVKGETPIGLGGTAQGYVKFANQTTGDEERVPPSGSRDIPDGETENFTYSFSMPNRDVEIDVEAWEDDPLQDDLGGSDSITVEAVTEDEKWWNEAKLVAAEWGPWTVGAATVGVVTHLDDPPTERAAWLLLGTAAGIGAKLAADAAKKQEPPWWLGG